MYRIRIRDHGMQELLAGGGIAVGVALVFGVLVANTSLTGSAKQAIGAVNGSAQLQLVAARPTGSVNSSATKQAACQAFRRRRICCGPTPLSSARAEGNRCSSLA
jgi:hypothetical protein